MAKVLFICGEDDFLVQQMGKRLFEELTCTLKSEFSQEIISGTVNSIAEAERACIQCIESLKTLPLWESRKVVWFREVNFLGDSPQAKSETTKAAIYKLQEYLMQLKIDTIDIVITANPIDRRTKEFKWFQSHTECTFISNSSEALSDTLFKNALEQCKPFGVSIQSAAWTLLLNKVQQEPRVIDQEIQKLITYLQPSGGVITEGLIQELIPNFGENDFFEISNAFYDCNLTATLVALQRQFITQSEGRPVLASLQNRNRLILQLKALMQLDTHLMTHGNLNKRTWESLKTTQTLSIFQQNAWYIGRLATIAARKPLEYWEALQLAFIHAFELFLERPDDHLGVLCQLAIKFLKSCD